MSFLPVQSASALAAHRGSSVAGGVSSLLVEVTARLCWGSNSSHSAGPVAFSQTAPISFKCRFIVIL
jgi:hypothetical protein